MHGMGYFIGGLVFTLVLVGIIPILIGGFFPFGKRASSGRTVTAWLVALFLGFASLNGGRFLIPVAAALALVGVACLVNRMRFPKT